MPAYAILRNPGHNSVYFNQSQHIALAELTIASRTFDTPCEQFKPAIIAGVEYITFESKESLTTEALTTLSRLSFVYALFEIVQHGDGILLAPVAAKQHYFMDEKLSSIFKYPGKTNTNFTRMMINVALLSSKYSNAQHIELLDPVAGKGTTLFEGLICGLNVSGIEIDQAAVHEASIFFKKNLEIEKYKHTFVKRKFAKNDKSMSAMIYEFAMARTKADFKRPETSKKLKFVAGNTMATNMCFGKNAFHIIVGDLPYGVAHGNVAKEKRGSLTRNPSELLTASLPVWYRVLKTGGAIVLAFNSNVLPRKEAASLLQNHGFTVLSDSPYDTFEHQVDRAIKRDIVVALK